MVRGRKRLKEAGAREMISLRAKGSRRAKETSSDPGAYRPLPSQS